MKKILLFIMFTLAAVIFPCAAMADGASGTSAVIDTAFSASSSLQSKVEALGLTNLTITELHVTFESSGSLTAADLAYIESMDNLRILDVSTSVGVSNAGDDFCAFHPSLEVVVFPAVTFGDRAFRECASLVSISLPNAVTFGTDAFQRCNLLSCVYLPRAETFGIRLFDVCPSLVYISLPRAETIGASSFYNCVNLTTVLLPRAESIGAFSFFDCDNIVTIDLSNVATLGTSSLIGSGRVSIIDLSGLTQFEDNTFNNCTQQIIMTLGSAVPTFAGFFPFGNYDAAANNGIILVPSGSAAAYDAADAAIDGIWFGWDIYAIGSPLSDMVTNGAAIINTEISASSTLQQKVEALGLNSSTITMLNITSYASGTLSAADIAYMQTMTNLRVLDVDDAVSTGAIGDDFFYNNDNLILVNFPAAQYGNRAFRECDGLVSIILPNALTFGTDAMQRCDNLTNVYMPAAQTFGRTAFDVCDSLSIISLPNAEVFGSDLFYDCDALVSVSLPSARTIQANGFYDCDSIASISLPALQTASSGFFAESNSLSSINLPSLTSIGDNMFGHNPLSITMLLGTTIPTFTGSSPFAVYDPVARGAQISVQGAVAERYDTSDGTVNRMWHGWTIVGFIAVNPQTGDSSHVYLYVIIAMIMAAIAAVILIIRKKAIKH
ncbi:MAG: leucine-rich repeat protein [Clostridia bacterium]|nr:leucine-rich repeat protein [Clostridia bacterium]